MKLILSTLVCIAIAGSLLAQEKYPTPKPTIDQKFNRVITQYWGLTAAAINLAKTSGVTPYEYGKTIGKIFVPSWGNSDFETMVKGILANWETIRRSKDTPPAARENQDGSVTIISDDNAIHDYFVNNPYNVSYDEFLQYFTGVVEVLVAELIDAKATLVHQDSLLITTIRRQ